MQNAKKVKKQNRPQVIISIPSMFLPAISSAGSVTGFSDPESMVYDFAQHVNKICCEFFRENMLIQNPVYEQANGGLNSVYGKDILRQDFFDFNKQIINYFMQRPSSNLLGAFYDDRLKFYDGCCDVLDMCNDIKSARDLFNVARDFYHTICLRMPAGQGVVLRNQMDALYKMLYTRSFPVYIVFDALRSRLKNTITDYEHSYDNCLRRLRWLNEGIDEKRNFFENYSDTSEFRNTRTKDKWGVAAMMAGIVVDDKVAIPVSQARFFVRDASASPDGFPLRQVKLSEVLAMHIRENEDF